MARGLRIPLRIVAGRLPLTSEVGESLRQVIAVGLAPGQVGNPFHAADGLVSFDPTFESADAGSARDQAVRLFRRLELQGRARLLSAPVVTARSDSGRIDVEIRYLDLESGQPGEVKIGG